MEFQLDGSEGKKRGDNWKMLLSDSYRFCPENERVARDFPFHQVSGWGLFLFFSFYNFHLMDSGCFLRIFVTGDANNAQPTTKDKQSLSKHPHLSITLLYFLFTALLSWISFLLDITLSAFQHN